MGSLIGFALPCWPSAALPSLKEDSRCIVVLPDPPSHEIPRPIADRLIVNAKPRTHPREMFVVLVLKFLLTVPGPIRNRAR